MSMQTSRNAFRTSIDFPNVRDRWIIFEEVPCPVCGKAAISNNSLEVCDTPRKELTDAGMMERPNAAELLWDDPTGNTICRNCDDDRYEAALVAKQEETTQRPLSVQANQ